MSRIDKFGRQEFALKMEVINSLSVYKDNAEDEFYKARITNRGVNYHKVAIDLDDGGRDVPKIPVESPNIQALINLGIWSKDTEDAFTLMSVNSFESMGTQEYKDAVIALQETPPVE